MWGVLSYRCVRQAVQSVGSSLFVRYLFNVQNAACAGSSIHQLDTATRIRGKPPPYYKYHTVELQ